MVGVVGSSPIAPTNFALAGLILAPQVSMSPSGRTISVDSEGKVVSVDQDDTRRRLQSLAWLLDSSIPIPGTRFTIGIDALIGLFPFIGDLIGVLLSSYILSEAARMGAPKAVLMRMAFNVGVEGVVGIVPVAGDVFDAAWKANQRNVRLLGAWLDEPKKAARSSRLFAAGLILAVAAFLALLGFVAFVGLRWLVGWMS
jgi:hypothetical protein